MHRTFTRSHEPSLASPKMGTWVPGKWSTYFHYHFHHFHFFIFIIILHTDFSLFFLFLPHFPTLSCLFVSLPQGSSVYFFAMALWSTESLSLPGKSSKGGSYGYSNYYWGWLYLKRGCFTERIRYVRTGFFNELSWWVRSRPGMVIRISFWASFSGWNREGGEILQEFALNILKLCSMVCLFDDIDVLHGPNHGIIHYPSSGGLRHIEPDWSQKIHQCFLAIQWLGGSL